MHKNSENMCVCRQGIHVQRYVESWMDWCRYQMRYGWEGSRIDVYRSGWYPFPNVYGEKSGGNKKSVLRQKRWPCTSVNCWFDRWVAARTHPNMNTFLFWPNNSFVVIIFVLLFSVCFRSRLVTNCILLCVRACVRASMGPFCCAGWKKINRSLWALISYWVLWPRRCHLFGNNPLFSDYSYSFCMAIVVLFVCLSVIPPSHHSGTQSVTHLAMKLVLSHSWVLYSHPHIHIHVWKIIYPFHPTFLPWWPSLTSFKKRFAFPMESLNIKLTFYCHPDGGQRIALLISRAA